ncbi:MAG: hypothetical protein U0840_17325 [Gemmataceae bacterium]
MEIQSLKLLVTDADIAAALRELAGQQEGLENFQARITPEGLLLQGEYATGFGFKVPFETTWLPAPAGPILQITLTNIKVAGLPAGLLRGVLFRTLADAAEQHPGMRVEGETVFLNIPELAAGRGFDVRLRLTALHLSTGSATLESA